jgi:hypothetical protein
MKAIEGQFIEAAGAVRWKATYGTQESIGPSHKSIEFVSVVRLAPLFFTFVTPSDAVCPVRRTLRAKRR